jgi:hypothetical protein
MIKKRRYLTYFGLLFAAVLLGIVLPLALNGSDQLDEGSTFDAAAASGPVGDQAANPGGSGQRELSGAPNLEPVSSQGSNCTYPLWYWQDHPEAWPAQIVLGGKVYTKEDAQALYTSAELDGKTILLQQVYTTLLNILNGAEMTAVETTLINTADWLDSNPNVDQLSELTRQQWLDAAEVLEWYNNGEIGPGACEDAPEPVALAPADTPTNTAPPPTEAPSPTAPQQQARSSGPAAASPGQSEPPSVGSQAPPPDPTDPPPPPPAATNPPPPATEPPPPTATEPPPPTATNPPPPTSTQPPPPTATDPPPAGSSSSGCPSGSPQPKGVELANKYGVSYEEIMSWNCQGWGFGEIDQVYSLSQETGASVDEIFAMRASGKGWGEIKKELKP